MSGAPGPSFLEIGRDILDKSVDVKKAVLPKRQGYRFSTKSLGDPRDIEKLADILVKAEEALRSARHPGVDLPRHRSRAAISCASSTCPAT